MFEHSNYHPFVTQVIESHGCKQSRLFAADRWQIFHRLQQLNIHCWCPADGSLFVEVNDAITAVLVRSTVQQFVAPRQELVGWLERCWEHS